MHYRTAYLAIFQDRGLDLCIGTLYRQYLLFVTP